MHRGVVGEHLQGNPNLDDLRDVGHVSIQLVCHQDEWDGGVWVAGVDQFRQTEKCRAEKSIAERTAQGIAPRCAP